MIRNMLLAAGVVMSSASQLSVPGLPLGYAELFFVIWIALSAGRILAGGRVELTPAFLHIGMFWVIFTLALGIGTLVGHFTSVLNKSQLVHDAFAYGLLIGLTSLATLEPDADHQLRRTAWFLLAFANLSLALQVALGWGLIHQSGADPWYWNRFRGWSENPNQLALYCAAYGPIALHLATTTQRTASRVLALAGLVLPFYVGRLTKSDTYLYTTILTCIIFLGLRLQMWLSASQSGSNLRRQLAIVTLAAAIPLSAALAPYALKDVGAAENFAKSLTKDKGGVATMETAELRLLLWREAVEKGLRSASLGLGPGAHLTRPAVINKEFLPLPFEAHSTILDLYLQGGLVAILSLFWLAGSAALSVWRARLDGLLALFASIGVFALPHLIIRHPIVWFALTLCLVAGMAQPTRQPIPVHAE